MVDEHALVVSGSKISWANIVRAWVVNLGHVGGPDARGV